MTTVISTALKFDRTLSDMNKVHKKFRTNDNENNKMTPSNITPQYYSQYCTVICFMRSTRCY